MTNNLYALYVKHIIEGDANGQEDPTISPQLKNIINNASTGTDGANKCMSFLNKKFGIKDVSSFCNFIKKLFTSATGAVGKFLTKIWSGIQTAMRWALKLIKKSKPTSVREDNFPNKISRASRAYKDTFNLFNYWGASGLALLSSGIITVVSKIENLAIDRALLHGRSYNIRQARYREATGSNYKSIKSIDFRIMECKAMFSDFDQFIESSRLSEGPEIRKFIDSFIQKIQPKAMGLWNKIDAIARSNKILGIVVAVCAACIFSYMGLKKYNK